MNDLPALDLDLLLVLHAVLEGGGVAAAARRLHVTPPAVSNALARLRAALGDPLLVRHGRGLVATPRALELAPVLARAFGELEQAVRGGPGFDPATSTRDFSLALADNDQLASLPRIARAFAARLPRARLRVVSVDTLVAAGGLAGSRIDVAVAPGSGGEELRHAPLYEDDAVLVVRRDHPRVGRRMSRERFNAERHVDIHLALGRAGIGNRMAVDAFARHGLVRDVAVTVPGFAAAAMVVAVTDLVGGMPRGVARALVAAAPIRIVTVPGATLRFAMQMWWHERTHHDPAARCFREVIAGAVGRHRE